jgi:hypothetical protein
MQLRDILLNAWIGTALGQRCQFNWVNERSYAVGWAELRPCRLSESWRRKRQEDHKKIGDEERKGHKKKGETNTQTIHGMVMTIGIFEFVAAFVQAAVIRALPIDTKRRQTSSLRMEALGRRRWMWRRCPA